MGMFGSRIVAGDGAGKYLPLPPIMGTATQSAPHQGFLGGLFKEGSTGRNILGSIGDALLMSQGAPPIYAQRRAQQREQDFALNRMGAQQDAELQRQIALQEWKNQHPDPAPPPPEQRLYEWYKGLGPGEQNAAVNILDRIRPKVIGDPVSGYDFAPRPGGIAPPAKQLPASVPQKEYLTYDMWKGAVATQGQGWAENWLRTNNLPVRIRTPDEARSLPKGTVFITPKGRRGTR